MEQQYGIVPIPKYSTNQKGYRSQMHDQFTVFAIPSSAAQNRLEMLGATLEVMASESARTVKPAYYEIAVKRKYMSDPVAWEMLDLIFANVKVDPGLIYTNSLEKPLQTLRDISVSKQNTVSSSFEKMRSKAKKSLAKLCVDSSTLVTITSFTENFSTSGICALLALVGLFITAVLYIKNVNGAILLGILATWVIGMLCQVAGIYVPDNVAYFSLFPTWGLTDFSKLGETFGQCFKVDFSTVSIANFIVIMCSFLFVDLFDTLGTLIGVATKANMIDEEGKLPGIKPALLADAIGTTAGAVLGTSTVTTFVESASGVAAGGRTGLTALTTGVLFLASTLFAPIFTAIPSFATAPALIMVGFLMVGTVSEIRFELDNLTEAIPAYLAIIAMPLFYSISEGISLGIISYVVLNLCTGKAKKVTPLMYVLALLFVLKYIFL